MLPGARTVVLGPRWTPRALFAGGRLGDWWTAADMASLFQDQAGATPVTANNDVVGNWRGQVNKLVVYQDTDTTALKPLYKSSLKTVETDGVDDFLVSSVTPGITASPLSIACVFDTGIATGANGAISYSNSTTEYRGVGVWSSGASGAAVDRAATSTASSPALTRPTGGLKSVFGLFDTAANGGVRYFYTSGTEGLIASPPAHTLTGLIHVGRLRTGLNYSAVGVHAFAVVDKIMSASEIANWNKYYGIT